MFNLKMFFGALAITTSLTAMAAGAEAKVYSIPSEDPVATINAPDSWQPNETDNGLELTSEDGGLYVDVEGVKADDIKSAVADTVTVLAKQGLVIDEASVKTNDEEEGGLKLHNFIYTGKDKDGPTNFSITLVETNVSDRFLLATFWGADAAFKANEAELNKILGSVQLTK